MSPTKLISLLLLVQPLLANSAEFASYRLSGNCIETSCNQINWKQAYTLDGDKLCFTTQTKTKSVLHSLQQKPKPCIR